VFCVKLNRTRREQQLCRHHLGIEVLERRSTINLGSYLHGNIFNKIFMSSVYYGFCCAIGNFVRSRRHHKSLQLKLPANSFVSETTLEHFSHSKTKPLTSGNSSRRNLISKSRRHRQQTRIQHWSSKLQANQK
jgi:hypothetical protein